MNLPRLRFKDDDGCEFLEWKETKVLNFAPLQRGFDLPVSTIVDGEFPVVFSNGILKHHNQFKSIAPGVVTGRSGTIGNVTYVNENYWPHNTSLWVTDFKQNLPKFVYYFYIHFDLTRFGTGSGVPTLNRNDVHRETVLVPTSFEEQTKIANFLTAVDEKITQLTQKSDLLSQYKKGVMQKIFSQELRFKDDDGREFPEWEEANLGDLCSITTGKLDANAMVEGGQYRFYTCAKEYYQIDQYAFDTDALLVSGNGANVGYIHHYKGKFNAYQRTYVLNGFEQNIIFVKYFLDCNLYERIFKEKKDGNTPYIVMGTLTEMEIRLPVLTEQTKIAKFLTAIDEKITATQAQLDAVKQYKQGLLQQMFI